MIEATELFKRLSYERKIDVLVEQYVFNHEITIQYLNSYALCTWFAKSDVKTDLMLVSLYSTLLTSAWEIVNEFYLFYLFRDIKSTLGVKWECKLHEDESGYYAWAETEQLAICYAGLKAVGFDLKGFIEREGK